MEKELDKPKVIYIAANSKSGSTLINLLLGTSSDCFCVGEMDRLKYYYYENFPKYIRNKDFLCDCGKKLKDCIFWGGIDERINFNNLIPFFSSFIEKIKILISIIFPKFQYLPKDYKEKELYIELLKRAKKVKSDNVKYIVDSSKNLRRLIYLNRLKKIDLTVIHVVRDGRGVVNSREKNNIFWLKTIFEWNFYNYLVSKFSRNNNKDFKYILFSYDLFARKPKKHLEKIKKIIDISLEIDSIVDNVNKEVFHNFSGNKMRWKKIETIRYDDDWKRNGTKMKRFILKILTYAGNKRWVYDQ